MDERKEGDMRECFYSKYLKPHTDQCITIKKLKYTLNTWKMQAYCRHIAWLLQLQDYIRYQIFTYCTACNRSLLRKMTLFITTTTTTSLLHTFKMSGDINILVNVCDIQVDVKPVLSLIFLNLHMTQVFSFESWTRDGRQRPRLNCEVVSVSKPRTPKQKQQ